MPICRKDGKNILFIHVPKSGGSTLETAFKNSGYKVPYLDGKMGPDSINYLRKCSPQHMQAEILTSLFNLDRFDGICMIVRNPLKRFISEYGMRNRDVTVHSADHMIEWTQKTFRSYITNPYIHDNHIRPQHEFYVPGCSVYYLEDGMENIIDGINDEYGLDLAADVPRIRDRRTESGFATDELQVPDEVIRRVTDFYSPDYATFNYARPELTQQ